MGARFWQFAIWAVLVLQLLIATLYLLDLTSSLTGIRARPDSWALYELQEIGIFLALAAGAAIAALPIPKAGCARRKASSRGLSPNSSALGV